MCMQAFHAPAAANFRAKIRALPSKCAPDILGKKTLTDIQESLKKFHDEALGELSDFDPEQYGLSTGEEGAQAGSSAAGSEAQPMGGPVPIPER